MHKNIPSWLFWGILIFPIVITISGVMYFVSSSPSVETLSPLLWMIIPSIIFEQILEQHFFTLSNNLIANLIFIFLFWFLIGAIFGGIKTKLTKKRN